MFRRYFALLMTITEFLNLLFGIIFFTNLLLIKKQHCTARRENVEQPARIIKYCMYALHE